MIIDQHKPIMSNEILSFIEHEENLEILDCTFGGGGHSKQFLERGHSVTAIDQDNNSCIIAETVKKKFSNFVFYKCNFKDIDLIKIKSNKYNMILLDLGYSSNQLENEEIGLSFKINSRLNMNYLDSDLNAYKIINYYSKEKLQKVFYLYGDIKQSEKLAKYIIERRRLKKIKTNFEFIEILRDSGVNFRSKKIHFATQAFQALRIETNNEIENLITFLEKVHNYLRINAYLVVMSFHSLEDRIVKNYFKKNRIKKNNQFLENKNWGFQILTKKPLVASNYEVSENNRSRSAKLRVGKFIN